MVFLIVRAPPSFLMPPPVLSEIVLLTIVSTAPFRIPPPSLPLFPEMVLFVTVAVPPELLYKPPPEEPSTEDGAPLFEMVLRVTCRVPSLKMPPRWSRCYRQESNR